MLPPTNNWSSYTEIATDITTQNTYYLSMVSNQYKNRGKTSKCVFFQSIIPRGNSSEINRKCFSRVDRLLVVTEKSNEQRAL